MPKNTATSLILFSALLLTYYAPAALAFVLFLEHARHAPSSYLKALYLAFYKNKTNKNGVFMLFLLWWYGDNMYAYVDFLSIISLLFTKWKLFLCEMILHIRPLCFYVILQTCYLSPLDPYKIVEILIFLCISLTLWHILNYDSLLLYAQYSLAPCI